MINKTKLALGIATATLTMAGALVSPQAMAASKAARVSEAANNRVDAMEAQLQAMQAEINRLKAEKSRPSSDAGKVQELDQWMTSVKSAPVKAVAKDNLISFRGGWMHMNDNRNGTQTLQGMNPTFSTSRDATYYGGAIDFNVNNDLFGLMDHTSFGMELGLEYAQLGFAKPNGLAGATANVNQLRLNVSPKIKFMHGSKFRPWLIPAGLDINIISPPSSAITVMNTGMQFGAGAEYELLKGIVLGADGRYHKTFDSIDGVNTNGFTLGSSIGFKW
jgi:opacity protein-like surface antigen